MLAKKDNSSNTAYILSVPSQRKTTNNFSHQHLRRYNLDAQALRNDNFSTTEDALFPQTQTFPCLIFNSITASFKSKNGSHIPHPSTSKKCQHTMQILSSVGAQQKALGFFAQNHLPFHWPLCHWNGKLEMLNEYPSSATPSGKGILWRLTYTPWGSCSHRTVKRFSQKWGPELVLNHHPFYAQL